MLLHAASGSKEVAKSVVRLRTCPDGVKRLIIGHHKLGLNLASRLHNSVRMSTGCDVVVLSSSQCRSGDLAGAAVVNLIQNPFDFLISMYMYHKRGSEPWANCPMTADEECDKKFSSNPIWQSNLAAVRKISSSTHLFQNTSYNQKILLKPLTKGESYASYLQKSKLENGLVVTYVFDNFMGGLAGMGSVSSRLQAAATVCMDDINLKNFSSLNADLAHILDTLELKGVVQLNTRKASYHFVDHRAIKSYKPMMRVLRTWDSRKNSGEIAALESQLSCGIVNKKFLPEV